MINYECVIVFDGLLPDEEIKAQQEKIQEIIIKDGGQINRIDVWGKKHLCFEIKHRREGFYTVFYFSAPKGAKLLKELDYSCRIEEKILRHMICHEIKTKTAEVAPAASATAPAEQTAESVPAPAADETAHTTEQSAPATEQPAPAAEQSAPAAEQPAPAADETAPTAENTPVETTPVA